MLTILTASNSTWVWYPSTGVMCRNGEPLGIAKRPEPVIGKPMTVKVLTMDSEGRSLTFHRWTTTEVTAHSGL